jgi:hypothetical protein
MANEQDKTIRDAQYRKGLSIAFFNATNSAIAIMSKQPILSETDMKAGIEFWRNWFLDEHKNYYTTVIANVGITYRAEESIAKLKETKTLEELQMVWRLLSEDERRDGEIIKVAQQLRKGYKNEKA